MYDDWLILVTDLLIIPIKEHFAWSLLHANENLSVKKKTKF